MGSPQGLVLVGANDTMSSCSASWQPPSQNGTLSPPGQNARCPPPHTHTVVPPQMPVIPVTVPASRSRAWRKYRHKPVDPIVLQVSQPGNDGGRAVGMPRRGGRGSVTTQVPRDGHKKRSATEEAMSFASHVLTQRRPERSQVGMPSLQRDLTWIQASRSPNGQTNLFFFLVPEKETLGCQREMTCM